MSATRLAVWLGGLTACATAVTIVAAPQTPGSPGPGNPIVFRPNSTVAPEQPFSLFDVRPAADHPAVITPTGTAAEAAAAATAEWVRAWPVGNGRLGAMVFGGVAFERLQLNEGTLWAGRPYDPLNPDGRAALPGVRQLIFDGKYADAAKLVTDKVLSRPLRQMPYQTLGNLRLAFPAPAAVDGYRRDLNLDTAIANVSYTAGGVRFTREVFASAVDQLIVVRLAATPTGKIAFRATFDTQQRASIRTEGPDLVVTGVNGDGVGTTADGRPMTGALRFQTRIRVLTAGGSVVAEADGLSVSGATSATLLISAATSYRRFDDVSGDPEAETKRILNAAARKSYAALRTAHVLDYQQLFHRVSLDFGHTMAVNTATSDRIAAFAKGEDPMLAALYFQYGRYLLISSSRPGGQPATLQGLWNESMSPPWGSKYTININTEMNYWPASAANLDECLDPLVAMVLDLTVTGARTARDLYGAGGWVTHHNTDLWRATGPIDGAQSGMWPTGGAWLALQLWDRYLYTGDRDYLAKVYPALRGASEFFLDTLVEDPVHHWLVTNPSLSPENVHPFGASVAAGPAMDEEILRDLFDATTRASEDLGVDAGLRARWTTTRERLAPLRIGAAGQLQEWLEDWDLQARDIHHRHVSHLYALFPSRQIDRRETPGLAAAAKRSLELRGDQATGWATAWRINLWARLGDGDHAFKILEFLLSPERTYPNMFDAHPPFQIDGNFGGTSAIIEMLMQSRDRGASATPRVEIEVLPALPSAWSNGSVHGLRARGGVAVDVVWANGAPTSVVVRSKTRQTVRLRFGDTIHDVVLTPDVGLTWKGR